jgi:hypothetical protein
MARRPLAASRRNPLTVIEPSGYAKTAATARRSGVSSPTSLRAGMWRRFLSRSALAFAISLKEKNTVSGIQRTFVRYPYLYATVGVG